MAWDNGGDPSQPPEQTNTTYKQWWRARDAVWPLPATKDQAKPYLDKLMAERISKKDPTLSDASLEGVSAAVWPALRNQYARDQVTARRIDLPRPKELRHTAAMKRLAACFLLLVSCGLCRRNDLLCGPGPPGSMANSGSSVSPWSTLEAVFAANKTFSARRRPSAAVPAFHGLPQIKGTNAAVVSIVPSVGAHPTLRRLIV